MRRISYWAYVSIVLLMALVALACSGLTVIPTPGTEPSRTAYRYDNLPDAGQQDASLSEYRAISQWEKFELAYFFTNGTDRLSGDRERDLVREAFALWVAQTPLTFTEVNDPGRADILIS